MTPREKAINHLALRIEKLIAHAAKQPIERHRLNSQQIANAAFEDFESYRSAVDLAHECPKCPRRALTRPAGDGRLGLMECCTCGCSWTPEI